MHRHLNDLTIRNLTPKDARICWDKNLPAFGVRLGKRRKTFIVKKANAYITLGHYGVITLAEARSRAKTHLYARYLPRPATNATAAAEEYLTTISGEKRPATINVYTIYIKRLPNKPLMDLTPQALYAALPEGRSAANLCFNVFKAFLTWCVERSYLDANPLLKRRQPNKLKSRDRLLTDDEIKLIWRESYNHDAFGAIARLLLLTGQRLNQIASLHSSWVQAATITFPAYVMKNNTRTHHPNDRSASPTNPASRLQHQANRHLHLSKEAARRVTTDPPLDPARFPPLLFLNVIAARHPHLHHRSNSRAHHGLKE